MITLYNLDQIKNSIESKYDQILKVSEENQIEAVQDYLIYLVELYEGGSIGYAILPNKVLSIAGISNDIDTSYSEVVDLASELDLPNHHLDKGIDRDRDTKRLIQMIREHLY